METRELGPRPFAMSNNGRDSGPTKSLTGAGVGPGPQPTREQENLQRRIDELDQRMTRLELEVQGLRPIEPPRNENA